MNDFPLVTTDRLFAKISDQLNSYSISGLLDEGRFYSEVMLCINTFGIAAYDLVDAIVILDNHRVALPCNFYLLDSAWLCDHASSHSLPILQSNFVMYTETTDETICQKTCSSNNTILDITNNGVTIQSTACNNNNENVLNKTTVKEYIIPENQQTITWRNPVLMRLKNKKSIGGHVCAKDCKNLFAQSPYEISIKQQGINKYLHSNLKEPTILLKYYSYPEDPDTGLPLIPEDPIIQRAIEYHLMHYFFYMAWLDGNDVNIEKKIQALRQDRDLYMQEAKNYSKISSFNKSIEMARNVRNRFSSYELLNFKHN